jgi:parallel beta-helix repeat protein
VVVTVGSAACAPQGSSVIEAGPEAQKQVLEALIMAQPGAVVELGAGTFTFDTTLAVDADGVTIRGQGAELTILDFAQQAPGSGGEGILATGDAIVVEDLQVVNTRGDAIKTEGSDGVTFRRLRVDWPGPVATENGAYGLYPVQSQNVLIEDCWVRGASDAGIYVGQSSNIVVRRSVATENVAGIEIENSVFADVYENEAYGNAGGLLVFALPELPIKQGSHARVYDNRIYANNHPNFGKPGAIVSTLPPGSGVIVMANDQVEIFDNEIRDNDSANLSISSFLITGREFDDAGYDPYPEGIWIHDNTFGEGGLNPQGRYAEMLQPLLGGVLPDIVWDGVVDAAKEVDGVLSSELGIYIEGNGDATFANFDLRGILAGQPKVATDLSAHAGQLPSPPPAVVLPQDGVVASGG